MAKLDSRSVRRAFVVHREPYWLSVEKGCSLGYRRLKTGGSWIARYCHKSTREMCWLGTSVDGFPEDYQPEAALDFNAALALAQKWFLEMKDAKTINSGNLKRSGLM